METYVYYLDLHLDKLLFQGQWRISVKDQNCRQYF